jgi:hypothetical protein
MANVKMNLGGWAKLWGFNWIGMVSVRDKRRALVNGEINFGFHVINARKF